MSPPPEFISQVLPELALGVSTRALAKHFGELRAVDGIDVEIPTGTIFALPGSNGAGTTTLMRMLATVTMSDAGSAQSSS